MASMAVNSLKDLKELGRKLLSSRREINTLPRLLQFVSPNHSPQFVLESLLSLQAFFIPIIPQIRSSSSKRRAKSSEKDLESDYNSWVRERYDEFIEALIGVLVCPESEETLKDVVLDAVMEFVKLGNGGRFQSSIYHKLIQSIVNSTVQVDVLSGLLASNYFKYIDVRYFTYISLDKVAKTLEGQDGADNIKDLSRESLESSIHNIHNILSHIPPIGSQNEKSDCEMWSGSGLPTKKDGKGEKSEEDKMLKTEKQSKNALSATSISKKMKLKFTKAWISFLRLPLPLDVYKEVLVTLHQAVIPYISNPIMLCDFLTRSYDVGGVVSVMALSSLYILMTQHGLEYPNFYDKLYALLAPSIFMAKFRAKFFELLDSCLKSPLLPAYLAAAFAKKLSRLSLSVPPSGSLVIIALIHNLLRRHPSINCLVHRENGSETASDDLEALKQTGDGKDDSEVTIDKSSKKRGIDHFNNEEINPLKSNAMKSSLWEIDTLRHHYCPPVSRFVLSLENDLTVRAKTTEMNVKDFSSGSYGTIFGEEIRRRVKQVPLAFYKSAPSTLFSETDFPGWTFKYEHSEEKNTDDSGNKSKEHNPTSGKRQRIECS